MRHLIIPDTQIRPDDDLSFLTWIGEYIVDKKPDVVVQLGDWADMHSLSSYDMGRKSGEGARYSEDIEAANAGIEALMAPINEYNNKRRKNKKALYTPRWVVTLGNHENRINKHVEAYPLLDKVLSTDDIKFKENGWEVYDFLEVVVVDGIAYSHFFPRGPNGRIMQTYRGAPNARVQVVREGRSCTAGHMQGLDWAVHPTGHNIQYGLIAGSCYKHQETYLSPQGTNHWRGIIVKNQVKNGEYDPLFVSLDYLERRYG